MIIVIVYKLKSAIVNHKFQDYVDKQLLIKNAQRGE